MDRNVIEIDYREALGRADELEEVGCRLMQALNQEYGQSMQMLAANWKGGNAETYLNKGTDLEGQMRETAKGIINAAGEIRRAAERIYQAEMEIIRIIEARNF